MKTLQQAYLEFDYAKLIDEQLAGTPQSINAYEECCGRFVGLNKVALIWEGKMVNQHNGRLSNLQKLLDSWQIIFNRLV